MRRRTPMEDERAALDGSRALLASGLGALNPARYVTSEESVLNAIVKHASSTTTSHQALQQSSYSLHEIISSAGKDP